MVKLKAKLKTHSLFLIFLPLFFIIHGYNAFFGFFPLPFVLLNLIITFAGTLVLFLFSTILLKNKQNSSLLTFWLLLVFLLFGSIHDTIIKFFGHGFFTSYKFILPLLMIIFLFFLLILRKTVLPYKKTYLFLNILFFIFILFELGSGIQKYIQQKKGANLIDNRFTAYKNFKPTTSIIDSLKPDIYFLVFDGMPSTKAMNEHWGFNNYILDTFLRKENFYISEHSKSNYNLTVLSLSSTLNMDYIPSIDISQDEIKMYFKASASLLNNSLTNLLAKEGYHILQYQPISFVNKDWEGSLFFKEMLYMNYLYKTLPGRIYRDLGWHLSSLKFNFINNFYYSKYEKRNIKAEKDINHLIHLVKSSCDTTKLMPQFVFAHFLIPHDPFIFDSTGKRKETNLTIQLSEEEQVTVFIDQVKYATKLIEQLVTYIKRNNKRNTVILLEGDHGYRNIYGKKGYMIFENLNAIYLPDKDHKTLYPTISPVNSFRVILNKYFSANLPLLQDSSIFIPYTLPGEK